MPLGLSQWRENILTEAVHNAENDSAQELTEDFYADNPDEVLSEDFLDAEANEKNNGHSELSVSKIREWLSEINPNFDPFDMESPYNYNCGSCAYAVYRRLEGDEGITAMPVIIPDERFMEPLTGLIFVSMTPEEIEAHLLAKGNGAHTIIGIDRAFGFPGHWFNAACIDGKVVVIEGQDGTISGWPPDYGDVVNWEMGLREDDLNGQ